MNSKPILTLYLAWAISLCASFGSLFFSDVMGFVPCPLCWYQRIFMYPLAIILGLGLFTQDNKAIKYAWPFSILGWLFSIYHNLLQWNIIPESAAPCKLGIPCSTAYINWLGFITIPFLAFIGFTLIILLLFLSNKKLNLQEKGL